jgi:hypothetical protein
MPWAAEAVDAPLPLLLGGAVGYALLQRARWQHSQRMLDLQSEEILYSNNELEKKFRDLQTTIEQLSLLSELAAAVSATLDVEKIYEQTLDRLVHPMGYQGAYLFLVDPDRVAIRGIHGERAVIGLDVNAGAALVRERRVGGRADGRRDWSPRRGRCQGSDQPIDAPSARAFGTPVVLVPLRVKGGYGVLAVTSSEPGRVGAWI